MRVSWCVSFHGTLTSYNISTYNECIRYHLHLVRLFENALALKNHIHLFLVS